jgi:serine/threonine protein kinase
VRVADFGLSRVMADLHTMASGAAPAHLWADCVVSAACVTTLLLPVAEMNVLAVQTGGLGTYEYMAPEVLAHQRYSEKVRVELIGPSLQTLYACQCCTALQWRCSLLTYSSCIRAGGRVLLWGGALGDVRPRDAIPWPEWHAGDLHMP